MQLRGQTNVVVPARLAPNVFRVGLLEHPALIESSGLAASFRHPGVFWTHNDTGDGAFLFAINRRGEHLGAFEVKGARLIDWEAITSDQSGSLYFADIGTNGLARSHSAIHRVQEPDPSNRWGPVEVEQTWYIRYPAEREDAESFFVHGGFGYIITKYDDVQRRVKMYRFNLSDTSSSIPLEFVTAITISGNVSDAALSPDANRLALVTSDGVTVLFVNGDVASAETARRESTDFDNTHLEGGTFTDSGIVTTSDGNPHVLLFTSPLLRGAPQFTTPLTNLVSFVGRSVTFVSEVVASPSATYEWRFNGNLIPGATNDSLTLTNLTLANAGTYEITASNYAGAARSRAELVVSEKVPDVRITELMASPAAGDADTADWWELTSFDSETNDLSGWRFNDATGGLIDAFTIPDGVVIQPGESIVFVEILSPEEFREWWGSNNVPSGVQIVTYTGAALSFRATGDSLRIWDDTATNDAAVATSVEFGRGLTGFTFILDSTSGEFGGTSQLGVGGAFQAVSGPDIGSPGLFLTNRPPRPWLEGKLEDASIRVSFSPSSGETYVLEVCDDIATCNWMTTGDVFQGTNAAPIFFREQRDRTRRFYRLRKQ